MAGVVGCAKCQAKQVFKDADLMGSETVIPGELQVGFYPLMPVDIVSDSYNSN